MRGDSSLAIRFSWLEQTKSITTIFWKQCTRSLTQFYSKVINVLSVISKLLSGIWRSIIHRPLLWTIMFSYLCIKINPEVTSVSPCPVMVLWEMFSCSCCFVVAKSCDSDFVLCLHFSCQREWKMKPPILLVLVICTVVSTNWKLVSKRNSGKSQKNIFFI